MPPIHPSQADVAAAYRTLIAHETEPKEQDFYRTRLQRLEQATEPVCEFDCRSRVAAAGVGVYCPQCSAKCADTDLATNLAKAIRAAWVDRLDWDELAQGALGFLTSTGRLIPSGGMALTAEQVEDVRLLAEMVENAKAPRYSLTDPAYGRDAAGRLRSALLPVTEPAEAAPCAICNVNETNHAGVSYYHPFTTELGPFDDDGNDQPAPAVPAEEETKAEDIEVTPEMLEACANLVFDTDVDASVAHTLQGMAKELRAYNAELAAEAASSPVVPAPPKPDRGSASKTYPKACFRSKTVTAGHG